MDGHLIRRNAQLETAIKSRPETNNLSFQHHVKELSSSLGSLLL